MFRARERGMSFWPFAVTLLGLIVFIIMWFSAAGERDQALQKAAKAEEAKGKMDEEMKAAIARLGAVSKPLGFQAGGNMTDPAEMERQMKDYAEKLKGVMVLEVPADRYTPAPDGATTEKTPAGTIKISYLTDAELADVPTYQAYLSKFELATRRMKLDIDRMIAAKATAEDEKAALTKSSDETIKEKDRRIAELMSEKNALDNQMREKETELKDQIAQITAQKDAKDTELETLRKQSSENETKLLAALNEAKGTVKTLVQREAPTLSEGPDGEVIVAQDGVAVVNRGKAQMLMPGTVFDVWGLAKGGAKYKKGSLKITSCDVETARGAIVEENSRDPIQKGDLIQSLTFSPNRVLHFALVGDFKKMGRSQAEAVLAKLGAKVDDKVTAETNFLVVGVPGAGQDSLDDTDAVKTAKDLGIRMITEEQLSSFTRY